MNTCPVMYDINRHLAENDYSESLSETAEKEVLSQIEDGDHLNDLVENASISALNGIESFMKKSAQAYLTGATVPEFNYETCPAWFKYLEEQKSLLIEQQKEEVLKEIERIKCEMYSH